MKMTDAKAAQNAAGMSKISRIFLKHAIHVSQLRVRKHHAVKKEVENNK